MSLLLLFNQKEDEILIFLLVTGSLKQNEVSGLVTQKTLSGAISKKDIDGQLIENVSGTINAREFGGTLNFKTQ